MLGSLPVVPQCFIVTYVSEITSPSTKETCSHKLTFSALCPLCLIQGSDLKSRQYPVGYTFCAYLNVSTVITDFHEPTSVYLGLRLAGYVYMVFIKSFIDLLLSKHCFIIMQFKCLTCGNLKCAAIFPPDHIHAAWTEVGREIKLCNNHNKTSQFWIIRSFKYFFQILTSQKNEVHIVSLCLCLWG